MGWRFIATRLNGDGTETPLDWDLPLEGGAPTDQVNGDGGLDGSLAPEIAHLKGDDGLPVFRPWQTAFYAQLDQDPDLYGGGVLAGFTQSGDRLALKAPGFTNYLRGQHYELTMTPRIGADPMDLAREIWAYQQGRPGGDLGVVVDPTTSARRIGTKAAAGAAADAGPYQLAWWKTPDLGKEFDDLAAYTPFDYRMRHRLEEGGVFTHRLQLQRRIGRRQTDLSFIVGVNVLDEPELDYDGADYAGRVVVLGAGEGSKRRRGVAARQDPDRLLRSVTVEDTTLASNEACARRAERELARRAGLPDFTELVVENHPNAPLGSYAAGDEILVQTGHGWTERLQVWVRILSVTINTAQDTAVLEVIRLEKVTQ